MTRISHKSRQGWCLALATAIIVVLMLLLFSDGLPPKEILHISQPTGTEAPIPGPSAFVAAE